MIKLSEMLSKLQLFMYTHNLQDQCMVSTESKCYMKVENGWKMQ
jgi:hypothetical protein